ncbi:MAG: sugar phosphate isomerase/epimerase [Prolixibacteraceae bacterium]
MKLGFVSAILPELSFEELIDYASENGFACVEVCCWPVGKAERRYAGVTHIDVDQMDDKKAAEINNYLREKGVTISAFGYYPNPLDPDSAKRDFYAGHIVKLMKAAVKLGVNQINTFIGRNQYQTVDENFEQFRIVWKPIIELAEQLKVKVGIENCPMLFTANEWPGGHNLATTPVIWRRMFREIPSRYFGLNYDPSHLLWMQMDYVRPLYEFREKLFHIHIKDAKVFPEKLNEVGILATPLEFHSPKLPGLGDINWGKFVSALTDVGYKGPACIEVEDRAFEDSVETKKYSLLLSKNYMKQFIL